MLGDLPPEFQRHRDDVVRRVLHDEATGGRLAGEGDLGDALGLRQRLAAFDAEAVDDVDHAGRHDVAQKLHQHEDRQRGLLGGLETTQLPAASAGASFHVAIRSGKFHRDDLPDDAERLAEVVGDGILVDLRQAAFLGAQYAGEVAEMIDRQRQIGEGRLAQRLAVVERLDERDEVELLLEDVGDLVEDLGPLGRRGLAPAVPRLVSGIQRELDVGRRRARDVAQFPTCHGARVVEVAALDGRYPPAADEVVVFFADQDLFGNLIKGLLIHGVLPGFRLCGVLLLGVAVGGVPLLAQCASIGASSTAVPSRACGRRVVPAARSHVRF